MNTQLSCRNANDYLDLYLLAGSLGDKEWQNEIMNKLHQCYGEMVKQDIKMEMENLWSEYRRLNTMIIDYYRILKTNPSNEKIKNHIKVLKHKRATIYRRIYVEEKRLD
ncbi:hypothetical protein [Niallia sp. Krafla_26]|uniref:hypothetical protein n=1 Tax=Niallia sp. Krafla_26 TaxID=3064703 RepID=UPI003D17013C